MNTYKNTDGVLIASAECEKTYGPVKSGDGTGAALCYSYGVKGFPDIRYGDPSNLTKYEGERDYASLLAFAQKNLGPSPSPPAPPSPTPPGECTYIQDTMVPEYGFKEVGASKEDCCKRCQSRTDCGVVAFQNGKCKYAQATAKQVHTPGSVLCVTKVAEFAV